MLATLLAVLGALLVLAGIGGLVWCVIDARRARRGGLSDAAFRRLLQRLAAVNAASVGAACLGLGLVIVAIVL